MFGGRFPSLTFSILAEELEAGRWGAAFSSAVWAQREVWMELPLGAGKTGQTQPGQAAFGKTLQTVPCAWWSGPLPPVGPQPQQVLSPSAQSQDARLGGQGTPVLRGCGVGDAGQA